MTNDILVSCTVASYNAENTIIETLESIKAQTYQNIELIVSDDCSTDHTVFICRKWIEENKQRFVRTKLLTVEKNTGVSANLNRISEACRGEWKKGIAGDDKLLPTCVEDYMDFVKEHPEAKWVSSYMKSYNETFDDVNCIGRFVVDSLSFFNKDAHGQLLELAKRNLINAPTLFLKSSFNLEIKYREDYSFEDWPFFIDALEKGYKCYFMPKETVCYRIHSSISNAKGKLFKYEIALQYREFEKERLFKYLTNRQIRGKLILWKTQDIIQKCGLNKKTTVMSFLYRKWCALVLKVYR